ncbi:RNA polymerase sigma factor for flagellar operon FliA [Vibrio xiamenensis]|uniref:RNA polymerase sigma factor for flagellar operon FliA n=1 Tax=Vibrio xiamenensis TaxID=861298 RepID=A0A1G7ZX78_9VIBR|nr:sigma-70 family RNA polymerase sigma factor [Vibrio xiamenensis]SDH13309.1 RNA polymerase sigma factor for flagellar operon FliA [Vibrio xiamenensis]
MLFARNAYHKTETRSEAQRAAVESQALQSHLALIHRALSRYRGVVDEATLEDLKQTALITFVTELRKFDHIVNDDFLRSATVRIRGAIIDELRQRDYLSRDKRTLSNQIKKAESILMGKLGRTPTISEVCRGLKISHQDYQDAMADMVLSDDVELFNIASSCDEDNEREALQLLVENELNKLPEEVRKVMYLMYVEGLSTQETALVLELNDIKVHRLKHKGIETLKTRLKDY